MSTSRTDSQAIQQQRMWGIKHRPDTFTGYTGAAAKHVGHQAQARHNSQAIQVQQQSMWGIKNGPDKFTGYTGAAAKAV